MNRNVQGEKLLFAATGFFLLLAPLSCCLFRGINQYNGYFIAAILLCIVLIVSSIVKLRVADKIHFPAPALLDVFVFLYLAYGLLHLLFIKPAHPEPAFFAKWYLLIILYIIVRLLPDKQKRRLLYILIFSGILQAFWALGQKAGIFASFSSQFPVTGSFTNPAHLAIYLSVCLIIIITLLATAERKLNQCFWYLLIIAGGVIFAALICCRSRTAFIALFTALPAVFSQMQCFKKIKPAHKILLWTGIPLLALSLAAGSYFLRPGSADARLLIWHVSSGMFKQAPVTGNGILSFQKEYMYRQAEYFQSHPQSPYAIAANNHYQAFNEFIHVACEQGTIGLLLLLAIFVCALIRGVNHHVKPPLILLMTASCFLYPADIFPLLLLFPLFIGLAGCNKVFGIRFLNRFSPAILCLGLIALSGIATWLWNVRIQYSATQKTLTVFATVAVTEKTDSLQFSSYYKLIKRNKDFALFYARSIYKTAPEEKAVVIMEELAQTITTSEMICDIGQLHQALQQYSRAEEYFLLARDMVPCRILPDYYLFRLYLQWQDRGKARETANRILAQPPSITGSVVLRVRHEVKNWLLTQSELSVPVESELSNSATPLKSEVNSK